MTRLPPGPRSTLLHAAAYARDPFARSLACLAKYGDRLRAEVAGAGPAALAELPYLEAVCLETLRLCPIAPYIARQLNAPLTVAACKAALRESRRDPAKRDLARVAGLVEACFRSDDYTDGQRAFAEKRRPRFTGR